MSDPFNVIFSLVRTNKDFTARQVAILRLVQTRKKPADRQIKALSAALGVSKPVASRAADKLETDGLVERSQLADDGRSCVLTLTPKGRAVMRDIAGEGAAEPSGLKTETGQEY